MAVANEVEEAAFADIEGGLRTLEQFLDRFSHNYPPDTIRMRELAIRLNNAANTIDRDWAVHKQELEYEEDG